MQRFENCVNLAGDKTPSDDVVEAPVFENCVNLAGDKTLKDPRTQNRPFENCVNLAGDKTAVASLSTALIV